MLEKGASVLSVVDKATELVVKCAIAVSAWAYPLVCVRARVCIRLSIVCMNNVGTAACGCHIPVKG